MLVGNLSLYDMSNKYHIQLSKSIRPEIKMRVG